MAQRPIMDPTKAPIGAITMAYQDYSFLKNWVNYYGDQFGRDHLYILSHGGDPKHKIIAEGANVIHLPRDETMQKWDRIRWFFLQNFTNGLLRYYNWIICGDVDEIVVVDPEQSSGLLDYIKRFDSPRTPKSISPLGLEIIHNPDCETQSINDTGPILKKRRIFRLNANYSKPCIVRTDVNFTVGGHANSHQPRKLDPHLYLLHLRFYDYERTTSRLKKRADLRKIITGDPDDQPKQPWSDGLKNYERMAHREPVATTIEFPEFRKKMIDDSKDLHDGKITFFGGGKSKELYRLPDRFTELF